MKTRIIRSLIAALGMMFCAAAGILTPPIWHGVSGRDFRPQATTMALLVLVLAVLLRRGFRWRFVDFVVALLVPEIIALSVIAHFSGFTWLEAFERFNLSWLFFMNLFFALPWLLGFLLGSLWLWLSERPKQAV